MKYAYPAIFTPESNGQYSVRFPDIEGCFTGGDSLPEAIEMATDALCLMLYDHEEDNEEIPAPSPVETIPLAAGEFISMVACDTLEYRKYFDNHAVKKTLTIPNWLNTMAERANINFSATLQVALKEALNIN